MSLDADAARGFDKLGLFQREEGSTHDARHRHPMKSANQHDD